MCSTQARSQGGGIGGNCPPQSQCSTINFEVDQADVQVKKMRQCKSTKLLEKIILLELTVEPDQSRMV